METIFASLSSAVEGSPFIALSAAFAWGILSVLLSPCHLASIPLIVGIIGEQKGMTVGRAFRTALLFSLGVLASIALIGAITAALGRMLGNVGGWVNYLVAAVFPHANVARNTVSARYVPVGGDEGETGGSFVTLFIEGDVQVTCVARFVAGPDGLVMGPESLGGWDAGSASAPPSGTLSVSLSVTRAGRRMDFVRSALLRPPISVTTTATP